MTETQIPPSTGQKPASNPNKTPTTVVADDAKPTPPALDQNVQKQTVIKEVRVVHIAQDVRNKTDQPVKVEGKVTQSHPKTQEVRIETPKGDVVVKIPNPPPLETPIKITLKPEPNAKEDIAKHIQARTAVIVEYKADIIQGEVAKEVIEVVEKTLSPKTVPDQKVQLKEGDVLQASFITPQITAENSKEIQDEAEYITQPNISQTTVSAETIVIVRDTSTLGKPVTDKLVLEPKTLEKSVTDKQGLEPKILAQNKTKAIVENVEDSDVDLARVLQKNFQPVVENQKPIVENQEITKVYTPNVDTKNVIIPQKDTHVLVQPVPQTSDIKTEDTPKKSVSDKAVAVENKAKKIVLESAVPKIGNKLTNKLPSEETIKLNTQQTTEFFSKTPQIGLKPQNPNTPKTYNQAIKITQIISSNGSEKKSDPIGAEQAVQGKKDIEKTDVKNADQNIKPTVIIKQSNNSKGKIETVTGVVTGTTPKGFPIISTPQNIPIIIQTKKGIAVGSQITFEIMPSSGQVLSPNPNTTLGEGALSGTAPLPVNAPFAFDPLRSLTWPALEDSLQVLQNTAPLIAQNLQQSLPTPTARLVSAGLFFLVALRLGNIENWLGTKTLNGLSNAGRRDLVERLTGDFSRISRQASETLAGDWRAISMPLLQDDQQISNLQFFVRHQADPDALNSGDNDENAKDEKQTRFVLNLSLSRMGKMQLDGLLKQKNLDVVIRTEDTLSNAMHHEIREKFERGLEQTNLQGGISFQENKQGWIDIALPQDQLKKVQDFTV